MPRSKQNPEKKIFLFFLFSILFHLLLVLLLYFLPPTRPSDLFQPSQPQVIWVKPENLPPLDIADIQKPTVEKTPDQAKLVSEYNQSVKEETVAPPQPKAVSKKSLPPTPFQQKKKINASSNTSEKKLIKPLAEKTTQETPLTEKKELLPVEKKELKTEEKKETSPLPEVLNEKKKAETSEPKKNLDLGLKPQDLAKIKAPEEKKNESKNLNLRPMGSGLEYGSPSGGLFSQEYYPDYKVGGKTYLNALRFQDVGYFARMKRILRMRWNPVPSVRAYLANHSLDSGKIQCVIGVALDPAGRMIELKVIRSSGVPGYDQEAMQTIRDSSPFESPPEKFLTEGELRMSWTFIVYL
ncbi:MAG: TonB C-terminal domain-containing protein [Deltaproteobacteria bacterium]|nr:TonB C-terminal domain-containing protein [Deltaproteobacteria bacterium]